MAAPARKPAERDLVAEAAKKALSDAKGDLRAATRMLEKAVRQSRQLRDDLMEPLIAQACYDAVRRQQQGNRKRAWAPPVEKLVPSRVSGAHRVVQLAAGTLAMFPLPSGKALGEATRDEISEAANFYEAQASDMTTKARWLRLVAQAMPNTTTAGQVLTEERLRELQEEARRG